MRRSAALIPAAAALLASVMAAGAARADDLTVVEIRREWSSIPFDPRPPSLDPWVTMSSAAKAAAQEVSKTRAMHASHFYAIASNRMPDAEFSLINSLIKRGCEPLDKEHPRWQAAAIVCDTMDVGRINIYTYYHGALVCDPHAPPVAIANALAVYTNQPPLDLPNCGD